MVRAMSEAMREVIYNNLKLRETEDLLEIWTKKEQGEWTDLAIEVVGELLQERLGYLPPAGGGSTSEPENVSLPVFYERSQVLWLEKRLYQVAVGSIVLSFVSGLLGLPKTQQIILSFFAMNEEMRAVSWIIAFVLYIVISSMWAAMMYFFVRAVGNILRILMEMERNSRRV